MTKNTKSFVLPLAFIGVMFFSLGFALGINSVLVPVLKGSLEISSAESYLIIAATFIPFLIFGYPAGLTIKKIGYKRTMVLSFLMFAIAFGLFIPSASYESFPLFLLASFISGSANAYLQAAVNPYITILGPIDSAAKRISIMGICNKLAWPIPPLFLAFLIGKEVTDITVADLFLPFYVIIAAFIALGIIAYMAPLPEVKAVGEDDSEEAAEACPYAAKKTSIWQFPHLLLGCLALFLYVGVETVSLGTLVDYATSLHLENAAMYAWIAPIGIVIGYICGIIFIPKYMSQATALKICSVLAIIGSVLSSTYTCRYIHLFHLIYGIGMFFNVACPMAFGYGRFRKVHQIRFISSDHGNGRRCCYSDLIWLSERHFRYSESILDLPSLLPVYSILWGSRIQNQNEINKDIHMDMESHSSKE